MKKITCLLLALMLMLSFAACGGSSVSNSAAYKNEIAMEQAAPAAASMGAMDYAEPMEAESGASTAPQGRKWIVTVDMSLETNDLESLQQALYKRIGDMEGYVENQSVYNGSIHSSRRYRNANLTVRIPADRITEFTQEIGGIANVISNNLRREDVTLQYVDTEGRVKALQTEEARLLELLAGAETMSDLLEIEARLSDVRYELESYTSRLRTLDNQIDYATVYLYIEEVQEYTPVEEPTFFERITEGFADSLDGLWESLQDLAVFLVVSFPYILVYGGIFLVIFLLTKKLRQKLKQRRKEKKAKKNKEPETGTDTAQQ